METMMMSMRMFKSSTNYIQYWTIGIFAWKIRAQTALELFWMHVCVVANMQALELIKIVVS